MKRGRPSHELEPGELAGHPDRDAMQVFIEMDVRRHCELYLMSGDETHLWRAWRAARATGDPSSTNLAWLAPCFDRIAAEPRNAARARQRDRRNWILLEYYRLTTTTTKDQARKQVAKRWGTTDGAVKQLVMEHEGRGQRGKKKLPGR